MKERGLVVYIEDDLSVAGMLLNQFAEQLADRCVKHFTSAEAALRCFNRKTGVIVTDNMLKGKMTGVELAEELRNSAYDGKIIYTGGQKVPDNKINLFDGIFMKPYNITSLISEIKGCPMEAQR